jgi:hypothetical protein
VFVPLHRSRTASPVGEPVRPRRAGAVLAVALGGIVTGLVGALFDKRQVGSGEYVLLGLVIAVVAVGCGVALARAIGRRGRV